MPGLYSHTTRASGLILTSAIYNGDHQNHINNHVPQMMDDYSANQTQMRAQTNPGASGTESLATSTAGEIERMRYTIALLKNTTYWYDPIVPASKLTYGTLQATTSGTSIDFTGIPSWARRIQVVFHGVSLSGTDNLLVRIGDSGGLETIGYQSFGTRVGSNTTLTGASNGFIVHAGAADRAVSCVLTLSLLDASEKIWVSDHFGAIDDTDIVNGGGRKELSDTLDRLSIIASGSDTFDAGAINIIYE